MAGLLLALGLLPGGMAQPDGPEAEYPEGGFVPITGGAEGRWVRVLYEGAQGHVSRFFIEGVPVFSSLSAPGPFEAEIAPEGNDLLTLRGAGFAIAFRDHPSGHVRFDAGPGVIRLTEAGGVAVSATGTRLHFAFSQKEAVLAPANRSGFEISVREGLFFVTGTAAFLVPAEPEDAARSLLLDEAAVEGDLLARVEVTPRGLVELPFRARIIASDLSGTRWRLMGDPGGAGGSVAMLFAPEVLDPEKVEVRYFEEVLDVLVPADVGRAQDLADALRHAPGERPEWHQEPGREGVLLVFTMPPAGVQAFEVRGEPPAVSPQTLAGLVLGVLFVVAAAVLLVVRRRQAAEEVEA